MPIKLKVGEDGKPVFVDDKPVYVHPDGKEVPFDVPAMYDKIGTLNAEVHRTRERADTAEAKLKTFADITDPAAAIKALGIVKNLDDKKLVDAGEVEKVKQEAIAAAEAKYKPLQDENAKLKTDLEGEMIGGRFSRSEYIIKKLNIPSDIAQARFGKQFKIENGQVIAYDASGNKIYSPSSPGDAASFDEAMEIIVNGYSGKASILKNEVPPGGGTPPNGQHGNGAAKSVTRAAFDQLSATARAEHIKAGGVISDV